jgi:hypothetical protein
MIISESVLLLLLLLLLLSVAVVVWYLCVDGQVYQALALFNETQRASHVKSCLFIQGRIMNEPTRPAL